jgi:diguanylate cyclase (GGDEF)-like protein
MDIKKTNSNTDSSNFIELSGSEHSSVNNKINIKITTGSIISSPLFRRFLTPIVITMTAFAVAVYIFAVPYLKNLVYSLEEKSVQTNLKNIHELIEANSLAIDAYKKSVTSAHKRQLRNITLFMETYLKNKYNQVQQEIITEEEAQWTALEDLKAFRYGKNDYVWVADYNGFYLSHPDPKMNMEDFSQVRDVFGNYVLTPLIDQARESGEGYNSFWWQRLDVDLPAEKLTYAKLFPQWEWVIGTGVYLDDLETEVILRKEKMVDELRQILQKITIAKTGYMYIFDAWNNIIIHPDEKLENTDMSSWKNPSTGNLLVEDLKAASKGLNNKVAYLWEHPIKNSGKMHEKIDWITHVDAFDWYVVASVYTDELNHSSILLRDRIMILSGLVVMLSIFSVALLMIRLLYPIRRLSYTAGLVEAGDLTAHTEVEGNDEISYLSKAFNSMIDQLREIINKLDQKVLERTRDLNEANEELTSTVGKLGQYNHEVTQLNHMAEKLHACNSMEEIYLVIVDTLSGLFHNAAGILYLNISANDNHEVLKPVARWGKHSNATSSYSLTECRSIDEKAIVIVNKPNDSETPCEHIHAEPPYVSICMPLFGQSEILGMINLIFVNVLNKMLPKEKEDALRNWKRVATTATDHLAMAIANMKLREKLQELSVRDDLTGLFNRRYMEETLQREFIQSQRSKRPIGVVILDVDFFKQFNDTYGHKAGDIVLVELAGLLSNTIRKGDIVCRYGGEEFLIIMPGISASTTMERAETVRTRVERELKIIYNDEWLPITISLGAAAFPDHGRTPEDVIKAADDALYKAKDDGRNRVFSA